jgi:glycosyltransferase involved in cell wall biosynthesis
MNKDPLKILYVVTKGNFGGAQRYVFDLAVKSKEAGHSVVIGAGTEGELLKRSNEQNIETKLITGLTRDVGIISEIKALYSLTLLIREFNPDVIHLNSSKTGVLGAIVGRILGVPKIIFTAHGWPVFEDRPKLWKVMAYTGSYLTTLLCHHTIEVSHHDHTLLMPGTKHKRSVIPTALTEINFYSRPEARDILFDKDTSEQHQTNTWLVSVAELHPNKNLSLVIDAVAEYNTTHHNKIFYTILGGGEQLNELTEQIKLRSQTDYIKLLGHTSGASLYLLAFDIFILPSKKEGMPYALLEAGQAGLPCIASNVGGIPEVIANLKTGLLIDPNNPKEIISTIDTLITHPDIRMNIATNLKQYIDEKHQLKSMFEVTEALYTL